MPCVMLLRSSVCVVQHERGHRAETVIAVTFFPDYAAATKREEALHLSDLADLIVTTTAARPLLAIAEAARFLADHLTTTALRQTRILALTAVFQACQRAWSMSRRRARPGSGFAGYRLYEQATTRRARFCRWCLLPANTRQPAGTFMARVIVAGAPRHRSLTLSQKLFTTAPWPSPVTVERIDGTPIDLMERVGRRRDR